MPLYVRKALTKYYTQIENLVNNLHAILTADRMQ